MKEKNQKFDAWLFWGAVALGTALFLFVAIKLRVILIVFLELPSFLLGVLFVLLASVVIALLLVCFIYACYIILYKIFFPFEICFSWKIIYTKDIKPSRFSLDEIKNNKNIYKKTVAAATLDKMRQDFLPFHPNNIPTIIMFPIEYSKTLRIAHLEEDGIFAFTTYKHAGPIPVCFQYPDEKWSCKELFSE